MAETVASALEVSVSFGRFDSHSLSWEKWSTFSPNRNLEEVEKCKTPGSVAQKKAYFEAHYKKIAARKAEELLDQQKVLENDSAIPENPNYGDGIGDEHKVNREIFMFEDRNSAEEVEKHEKEPSEDHNLSMDVKTEPKNGVQSSFSGNREDDALLKDLLNEEVKEEVLAGFPDVVEKGVSPLPVAQQKNPDLNLQRKPKKTKPMNVEKDTTKKVPKKLVVKSTQISTPKVAKSIAATKAASALKPPSTDKGRASSTLTVERKKGIPKCLHMSINLSSSTASLNTSRRSLIMEKMGEKEIVKRAFKSFQNNGEERSSSHKPPPSLMVTEQRGASSSTSVTNVRKDSGISSRLVKTATAIQRASATHVARSIERASKSKEENEAEIQKLRKHLTFKAKPLPSFYCAAASKSKGHNKEEDYKSETRE